MQFLSLFWAESIRCRLSRKAKVAVFGFSTSSSAATLPLNRKTVTEELGVSDEIASFTLPLGMTVNMDGTAIMQVIAAIFVAASSGYQVTFSSIAVIAILALIASIGTPRLQVQALSFCLRF